MIAAPRGAAARLSASWAVAACWSAGALICLTGYWPGAWWPMSLLAVAKRMS